MDNFETLKTGTLWMYRASNLANIARLETLIAEHKYPCEDCQAAIDGERRLGERILAVLHERGVPEVQPTTDDDLSWLPF